MTLKIPQKVKMAKKMEITLEMVCIISNCFVFTSTALAMTSYINFMFLKTFRTSNAAFRQRFKILILQSKFMNLTLPNRSYKIKARCVQVRINFTHLDRATKHGLTWSTLLKLSLYIKHYLLANYLIVLSTFSLLK